MRGAIEKWFVWTAMRVGNPQDVGHVDTSDYQSPVDFETQLN
ncbi:MAG: hypothetical protein WDM76_17220 [Limisphaerales bacterium]